jgi:virulence activator alpha
VRRARIQHEAIVRLLAADIVSEEAVLDSLRALRDEIAAISVRLDAAETVARTIPSREDYLLLNHRLARRIVQAHTDWLNDVERELGSRTRG